LDTLRRRQEEMEVMARNLQELNTQTASEASTIEVLQKQVGSSSGGGGGLSM